MILFFLVEMATTSKNENGDNGIGGNQGTSSSKKFFSYGFDIQYVKRFLLINKVLFPKVLSKTVGWLISLVVFRYLLYSLLQTDRVLFLCIFQYILCCQCSRGVSRLSCWTYFWTIL